MAAGEVAVGVGGGDVELWCGRVENMGNRERGTEGEREWQLTPMRG